MLFVRKNTRENNYSDLSDEALIQLYKATGKEVYVSELFQRYADKIYIIARKYLKERETSKDLVMTVFEKVLKNLAKTNVQAFGNWVHTITRNECAQFYRNQLSQGQKMKEWSDFEKKAHNTVENDPLIDLINEEEDAAVSMQLQNAIKALKKHQQVCIQLFFFGKKSYKEIATITGYSEKEVKSYIQHGKKNLRKYLTKNQM